MSPAPGRFRAQVLAGLVMASLACTVILGVQRLTPHDFPRHTTPGRAAFEDNVLELSADRERLCREAADQQAEIVRLRSRLENLERLNSPLFDEVNRLAREREIASATLNASADQLEAQYEVISAYEALLEEFDRRGYLPHPPPRTLPEHELPIPEIEGTVLWIAPEGSRVRLDAGALKGVKVGYTFTIYRRNSYVSKVIVEEVEDDTCTCRELDELRKEEIQKGDSASTRIF